MHFMNYIIILLILKYNLTDNCRLIQKKER